MNNRDDVVAVIPAYKPGPALVTLVDSLRRRNYAVVVVDDGSGPGSADVLNELRDDVVLITHPHNRGKGASLKSAFGVIPERLPHVGFLVTVDADGQHAPDDVDAVVAMARQRPESLVLGSRQLSGDVPLRSQFGNSVTRYAFSVSTGRHLQDTQTGLRACSVALLPALLEVDGDRYEYEINVLMRFVRKGIDLYEVPIETIYLDHNSSSHFRTVVDSARIYREILRYCGSSLISFGIDFTAFTVAALALGSFGSAGIAAANIGARLISGSVNFTLNRQYVFDRKYPGARTQPDRGGNGHLSPLAREAMLYAALAAGILAANTLLLLGITRFTGISPLLAKVLVEAGLFVAAWWVQRRFIFSSRRRRGVADPIPPSMAMDLDLRKDELQPVAAHAGSDQR